MIKKFSSLNSDKTKFWIGMQYQGPNQGKYENVEKPSHPQLSAPRAREG